MTSDVEVKVFEHIPEGWGCEKLIDCTTDGNISYGIVQPGQYTERGIPIIRVNNVNNGQLQLDDVLKVAPEIEEKYKRTRLVGGEVLLTLVGSTGQSFVAPEKLAGWNVPRAIAVIRPKEEIGADWINICLKSKPVQHFLDVRANTTVQKTLNLKDVRDIPIPIPPKEIKEQIESIAVSLQDKIELNRQINQTLEQIAQAIFKSWFVDFEPVKAKKEAKQNGQDPERAAMRAISGKTDKELDELEAQGRANVAGGTTPGATSPSYYEQLATTVALFPDDFIETELGQIPKGWTVEYLKDVTEIAYGKNLPTKELLQEGYPVFGGNGVIGFHSKYLYEEPRVLVACRGAASGKVLRSLPQSFVTNNSLVIDHEKKGYLTSCYLEPALMRYGLVELTSGSAQPQMTIANMNPVQIVIPTKNTIDVHRTLVEPIYKEILGFERQNSSLAAIRDIVLPRLLSGEIKPKNLMVEEV